MANQDYGQDQDFGQHDDQQEQAQMPDNSSGNPSQSGGVPNMQRDQGQGYDDQNDPRRQSPDQQAQGGQDNFDDAMRGDQSQTQPQRQASDEGQTTDANDSQSQGQDQGQGMDQGQTGGQWQNQSNQDY